MNYIIKPFEPKEAIQYPWRVIGAGCVPVKIQENKERWYPIRLFGRMEDVGYTLCGKYVHEDIMPILHLLDIEAMQKHGYEIPDFVLDKEPELKQLVEQKEDIGNFALILDKELRGYVIKYAKRENLDKSLVEIVQDEETANDVLMEAFSWRYSNVLDDLNISQAFWKTICLRLSQDPATTLTDKEREVLKNPYHEQKNTETTSIKVKEPKPELNRNEIALKIYIALNGNANTQYVTTDFDELVKKSYQAADEFIKHSHEINNNK